MIDCYMVWNLCNNLNLHVYCRIYAPNETRCYSYSYASALVSNIRKEWERPPQFISLVGDIRVASLANLLRPERLYFVRRSLVGHLEFVIL